MKHWRLLNISGMAMILLLAVCLTTGSGISQAAGNGQDQLFRAVSTDDLAAVKSYINEGKTLAVVNQASMSPLLVAVRNKRKEMAVLLVENGADVNFSRKSSGETPLFYAAGHGMTDIVALLLQNGAAIEAVDRHGWTPLTAAVFDRRADTIKVLLAHKADANHADTEGISTLMYAAQNGDVKTAELLLAHGADPTLKDEKGRTAIQYAQNKGHGDMVRLLTPKPAEKKK